MKVRLFRFLHYFIVTAMFCFGMAASIFLMVGEWTLCFLFYVTFIIFDMLENGV